MIHQEFMLVRPFTVAENVILGLPGERGGRLDLARATEAVRMLSGRHGLAVDPEARMSICRSASSSASKFLSCSIGGPVF